MNEKLTFNNVTLKKEEQEMTNQGLEQKKNEIMELIEAGKGHEALAITQSIEGEENLKCREKLQSKVAAVFYGSKDFETIKQNLTKVDIEGVKKVLDATENKSSFEGRLKKFRSLFPEEEYNTPAPEQKLITNPKTPSDFIKNSLVENNLDEALQLIQKYESDIATGKYKAEENEHFAPQVKLKHRKAEFIEACYKSNQLDKFFPPLEKLREAVLASTEGSEEYLGLTRSLDHKEAKHFNTCISLRDWEGAQEVIDSMIETSHNKKHNSKEERQAKLIKERSEDKKEKSDTNSTQGDDISTL